MKLRKAAPSQHPSKMTRIPEDTKDVKGPSDNGYPAQPQPTTNPYPNPILPTQSYSASDFDSGNPPPYTPSDFLSSSTRDLPPDQQVSLNDGARDREPFIGSHSVPAAKIPESNAVNASSAVNLTGPIHVLGAVRSSSNVTLANNVLVDGKVSSSSWILLSNDVTVEGKVDSSSKITLRNRVKVAGKVDASGSIV